MFLIKVTDKIEGNNVSVVFCDNKRTHCYFFLNKKKNMTSISIKLEKKLWVGSPSDYNKFRELDPISIKPK